MWKYELGVCLYFKICNNDSKNAICRGKLLIQEMMNLCFYTLRWGTSIFIFSLCLVTCRLVCRLVFKIPSVCLLCKINNTASICSQNCKVEDDFAVGVVLPSFSLSNIWKQFAQEKWNHLHTFEHVDPLPPAVVPWDCFRVKNSVIIKHFCLCAK